MLYYALAYAAGLYCAWYIWPAPPIWVTKAKDWVRSWFKK